MKHGPTAAARPPSFASVLAHALADCQPTPALLALLAQHWQLVCQWNSRVNLTAIGDPEQAAQLHYRDSLMGLPHLHGGPVADLGSGAGFPGLVLALTRPQWRFILVEPRRRRASFLQTAVARLRLQHVQVLAGKMEDGPPQACQHVVTRATFADADVLARACAWLRPGGSLLAWRAADAPPLPGAITHGYSLGGKDRRIDALVRT